MKRRTFIGLLGASALSVPFMLAERGLGQAGRTARKGAAKQQTPLRVKLPKDMTRLAEFLGQRSKGVYLLGGGVLAAAGGVEPAYANLLIDSKDFTAVKKSLFDFGVAPVSTADLPRNFIRFVYGDTPYNVLNMNFDTYVELAMTGQENGLIFFAHSYLSYSIDGRYALDPYEALQARTEDGKFHLIKPLRQPRTLLHGFDHCLAATFDQSLFGLQPSPQYRQIEDRVFHSTPSAADAKEIFSRLLDYSSDILEVGGLDATSRFLTAPVCVSAGQTTAGIDLTSVDAQLRQWQRDGEEVSARAFMTIVHRELKKKSAGKGSAQGLPEFVMANKELFRRVETLREAMIAEV